MFNVILSSVKTSFSRYAPVAQLDRASGFYPVCREFESLLGCQMLPWRLRIGESERLEYTRLAQWIEHLATNQGFVGVRVPRRVPKNLF